jgi:hypothetical protein
VRNGLIKYYIVFLLIIASCGSAPPPSKGNDAVGVDFKPYYNEFIDDLNLRNKRVAHSGITIRFDVMRSPINVGECHYSYPNHTVKINKNYWDKSSDTVKKIIIYHELGHCMLYRDHNNQLNSINQPMSIMYSKVLYGSVFLRDELQYINELMK